MRLNIHSKQYDQQHLTQRKSKVQSGKPTNHECPCEKTNTGQDNRRINVRKEKHRNEVRKEELTGAACDSIVSYRKCHSHRDRKAAIIVNIMHNTQRLPTNLG